MSEAITLIGGTHHLTTTTERSHLIGRQIREKIEDMKIPDEPPQCGAHASKPFIAEYYRLKEFLVLGKRKWFYVLNGLDSADALRMINEIYSK